MKRISIPIACKPNTCGNCRWWRFAEYVDCELIGTGRSLEHRAWCQVWKRWLEKERGHVYRCDECKESEVERCKR